jgi:hypothetical protein
VVRKLDAGGQQVIVYREALPPAAQGGAPVCARENDGTRVTLPLGMYPDNDWGRTAAAHLVQVLAGGPGSSQTWDDSDFQSHWVNRLSFEKVGEMQIGGATRTVDIVSSTREGTGSNWFKGIWTFLFDTRTFAPLEVKRDIVRGQISGNDAFTATSITVPGE